MAEKFSLKVIRTNKRILSGSMAALHRLAGVTTYILEQISYIIEEIVWIKRHGRLAVLSHLQHQL